jgi:hypothetical protein
MKVNLIYEVVLCTEYIYCDVLWVLVTNKTGS